MATNCPTCRSPIPVSALNLKGGTGWCNPCQKTWRIADLQGHAVLSDAEVDLPPLNCRLERFGETTTLTASMTGGEDRGIFVFACIWNGILSIFIFVAIAMTWKQITGSYPFKFLATGQNDFDSVKGVILLWGFLTPFMAVGAWTMSRGLLHIAGTLRVTIDRGVGRIWIGIGSIGRTRRFDAARVTNVKLKDSSWEMNGRRMPLIELTADRTIRFGTGMRDDRRRWVVAALKQSLLDSRPAFAVPSRTSALREPMHCPECRALIPRDAVDAERSHAQCSECNKLWNLDDLAEQIERFDLSRVDVANPPRGCSARMDSSGMVYYASLRSLSNIFLSLFVVLFWNGILSVFLALQIVDTRKHFGWTLPTWFPTMNSSPKPWIMTIGVWIFLTPFIVIGLCFIGMLLSCIFGGVCVFIDGDHGTVRTGIGPVARCKRFNVAQIENVHLKQSQSPETNSERLLEIIIEGGPKPIRFGSMLPKPRKRWLAAAIRDVIRPAC